MRRRVRGWWLNGLIVLLLGLPVLALGLGQAAGMGRVVTAPTPRGAMSAPVVSIVKWSTYPSVAEVETMVRQALELALGEQGMAAVVAPGDTVIIKPNLGGADEPPQPWEITTWPVVQAVVNACREAGASRVVIGENPFRGLRRYDLAGYSANISGAELLDYSALPVSGVLVPANLSLWPSGEALLLPHEYVRTGAKVITIPKMKTHNNAGITLGLKNAVGVPTLGDYSTGGGWRDRFHNYYGLHKTITQINLARPPDLEIVDAIVGGEGQGPWGATPVTMTMILAGRDVVAVDAVGAQVMGFDPERIRHLVYAARKGLGEMDLARIEVVGASIAEVQQDFARPNANDREYALYRRATTLGAPPAGLTLDGDLGEWASAPLLRADRDGQAWGTAGAWSGANDASLHAWAAWDSAALYLAVRVWDDTLRQNTRLPAQLSDGDALEIYFSGANQDQNGRGPVYGADDYRLGLGYGQSVLYNLRTNSAVPGTQLARRILADGYTVELRIPFTALHGYAAAVNREIGLDIALDDADATDHRETQVIWSGTDMLPSEVREMGVALLTQGGTDPTATATPTASPSATATPTRTETASPTRTPSATATSSVTATTTKTPAPTATLTPTTTPTTTPTPSPTETATPSRKATPTPTRTETATLVPTETATPTPLRVLLPLLLM
jgi:uncharacterized protein (DUF362 family)